MSDKKWIAKIQKITDPRKLLVEVVAHFHMIPTDPYYRDLTNALLAQCEKIAVEK